MAEIGRVPHFLSVLSVFICVHLWLFLSSRRRLGSAIQRATLRLAPAHHAPADQVAVLLGDDGALAGTRSVGEVDDDPVARLVQPMRERRVREEGTTAPFAANRAKHR